MNTPPINRDTIRSWMMAELDGEATPEQQAEIHRWLAADPGLQREYDEMAKNRQHLLGARLREPGQEVWDSYWQGVYRRVERGIGWILLSIGAIVLMGYGAWELAREWVTDNSIPLWVRGAGVAVAGGGIILLVSVIREKYFLHKHERYKDIQR